MSPLLLLLLACPPGGDTGSTGACTDVGCIDGVDAGFSLTEPGSYTIVAEELPEGVTTTCTASLPFDGTEGCTGPGSIGLSGTALPPDQQSIEGMAFPSTAMEQLHLTITRDSASILDETYDVAYATLQPNGPDCPPTCSYASVEVTVAGR